MPLEAIDFQVADIVHDVLKLLEVRTHGKGISLTCHIAPGVPKMLIGDPTRLRQILCNLVGNAVKFTDRGEVGVKVEVESTTEAAVCLHFTVHDTGIGIAQQAQEKIFEAFTQENNSTSRKHGGTGLGLSITSRLVKLMSGRIWLKSTAGQGSTFHFPANFKLLNEPETKMEMSGAQEQVQTDR